MAALDQSPNGKKSKRSAPRIDMTPMVDLAFLLLTFFVMTTTLMKNNVIEMQQPVADTGVPAEIKAERVLNLVLAKDDQVFWYMGLPGSETKTTDYSKSGVRKLLLQKNAEIKNLYVFIKASDEARYQNIIDILDEVKISNISNYVLLKPEPGDENLND